MSAPPFKVKAVYDYASPHDDDLDFSAGQIITVTHEEDAEWYVGEYKAEDGKTKDGLFPRNFVERFEPQAPPRPQRSRPKADPQTVSEPTPAVSQQRESVDPVSEGASEHASTPREASLTAESPVPAAEDPPAAPKPQSAARPPPAATAKPPPPETTTKSSSSSFKDRIAAFNKPAAPPVAPKPSGAPGGQSFIKKPFVAPPPSRNAYVPPAPRQDAPQKTYRREEDPEISDRMAQNQRDAEVAGVSGAQAQLEPEDAPKTTSLKDRIALLQKQQQEQAARRADPSSKPKRPAQPRTESDDHIGEEDVPVTRRDVQSPERVPRGSADFARPVPGRLPSEDVDSEEIARGAISDGNEADQSGAGETTEDAGGDSTEVDESKETAQPRTSALPSRPSISSGSREPARDHGEHEEHTSENEVHDEEKEGQRSDEEEEEIDPEARRREELRARMAKMSGGMGMAGMFGMPPPKPPAPARKPSDHRSPSAETRSPPPPVQRVPMVPVPAVPSHDSARPSTEDSSPHVEKEPETAPLLGESAPAETVPDLEDLGPKPRDEVHGVEHGKPQLPQERPLPPPPPSRQTAPAPPIPGNRPLSGVQARPVPPPPPSRIPPNDDDDDDDDGGSSDGVEPDAFSKESKPESQSQVPDFAHRETPIDSPTEPKRTSRTLTEISSAPLGSSSITEKRTSQIPPIPSAAPQMPPLPAQERPPPPPPPSAVPPSRQSLDRGPLSTSPPEHEERDSEYEGDYDTDIAPTASHKDALKSRIGREPSVGDDSTLSEGTSGRSPVAAPPPIPQMQRAVPPPPPPPHQAPPPRRSGDAPRVAPPPIPPPRPSDEDDNDYDPYRYDGPIPAPSRKETGGTDASSSSKAASPRDAPRQSLPPTAPPRPPPAVHNVPPPLPPEHRDPPLAPPHEPASMEDEEHRQSINPPRRSMTGRRSMDPGSRPHGDDGGHIARDVELDTSTLWWAHPSTPPPALQNRSDLLVESEESTTAKRGGRSITSKDMYVLFQDYSQTIITATYDTKDPARDVHLEQRHEAPPPKLRQDQLEAAYVRYGERIAAAAMTKQNQTVGDGSPAAVVSELLKAAGPNVLQPVGARAYGALVYQNMQNSSVFQYDEIRPGDIVSFRNAKFKGKHGPMHAKYSMDVGKPDHVGVVMEWDGTKKKIRALEQGREKEGKKVKLESFRVGDLGAGEVKVWRVVGRDYVGWESNA